MGSDLTIVNAARVSYLGESKGEEADKKLLFYLMRNGHTSPFEMAILQFRIKCPLFVARQWMRHRTWCVAYDTKITFNRPDRWKYGTHALLKGNKNRTITIEDVYRNHKKPSLLRVYDENENNFTVSNNYEVTASGVKPLYWVELENGYTIRSTDRHKFYTTSGWQELGNIQNGMSVAFQSKGRSIEPELIEVDESKEIWKTVDYKYNVSSYGRVRSKLNTKNNPLETPKIKDLTINKAGRVVVSLSYDGISKAYQVSHLVYKTFIGEISGFVLHKNGNAGDNRPENLYLGTAKDNADDREKHNGRSTLSLDFSPIRKIEYDGYGSTYDITVYGEHHNFLANDILVHNSYNEVSRRYTSEDIDFYIPDEFRYQAEDNKQVSYSSTDYEDSEVSEQYRDIVDQHSYHSLGLYNAMITAGIAREQARMVLPQNIYTMFIATVDLHNLLHFCKLRAHPHAQYEIQVYAHAILDIIKDYFPWTYEAFTTNSNN
jgi:thymidylate synthase (FAD)